MNLKDYQKGRNDGLALAAKIIQEGGVEALHKEIQARKAYGVDTNLTMKELDDAAAPIKQQIFKSMLVMSLHTLEDEFDFGNKRLMQFMNRFEKKTSCLAGSWVTWFDIVNDFEKRRKIKLRMPLEMD